MGNVQKLLNLQMRWQKMIIESSAVEDKFWTTTSVDIFTGFVLKLFEETSEEGCHLKGLSEMWNAYLNDRKAFVRDII